MLFIGYDTKKQFCLSYKQNIYSYVTNKLKFTYYIIEPLKLLSSTLDKLLFNYNNRLLLLAARLQDWHPY